MIDRRRKQEPGMTGKMRIKKVQEIREIDENIHMKENIVIDVCN